MMKLWKFFACAGLAVLAAGCTSVNTNDAASDSKQAMIPTVFEPVVKYENKKVNGEANLHVLFGIFKWGCSEYADRTVLGGDASIDSWTNIFPNPLRDTKAAAVYNACRKAGCDMIISGKYKIKMTDYFIYKNINCKVSGFPGTEIGVQKKDIAFPKSFNGNMIVTPVSLN